MYQLRKNKRRIMSWVLVLCMLLTLLPATVFASEDTSWDNLADTSWYNIMDTEFSISTEAQLAGLALIVNGMKDGINQDSFGGKTIILTENLDLGGKNNSGTWSGLSWIPIGTSSFKFEGTFNGNGKTISNLYISANERYQGLFGYIDTSGKVKNLKLFDGYVFNTERYTAALAGYNSGVILNCSANVIVEGQTLYTGGLSGQNAGYILNSCNTGDLSAIISGTTAAMIGGISGYNTGTVRDCYNTGNVSVSMTGATGYCGTAIGRSTGTVSNIYSTGELTCPDGIKYVGVVAGSATRTITNTYYLKTESINAGYYGIGQNSTDVTTDASGTDSNNDVGMKALAETLGNAFQTDSKNINKGYPILPWQDTEEYVDETDGLDIASKPVELTSKGFSVTLNKKLEYSKLSPSDFKITYVTNGGEKKVGLTTLTQSVSEDVTAVKFSFPELSAGTGVCYKVQYKNGTVFQSDTFDIAESDYWTSYADYDIEGTGSYNNPFQIATANQLAYMANSPSTFAGKYVVLTQDINLNGKLWVPGAFQGFFDGQGHSITNMTSNGDLTGGNSGLFGSVTPSTGNTVAYLANIRIIEPNITYTGSGVRAYMGALAAQIEDTNILNCSVEGGTVDGSTATQSTGFIGGLVGSLKCSNTMESMYINNCSSTAVVKGKSSTGGILGYSDRGNTSYGTVYINDCYTGGRITGAGSVGGIVGEMQRTKGFGLDHCFSTAEVVATGTGTSAAAGGLVGHVAYGTSGQVIGPDGLTVTNSAVLNTSISTANSSEFTERLVGNGKALMEYGRLALSNNFGWELTKINGDMVSGSELYGTNFTTDTAYTKAFWEETLGFDFSDKGRWNWTGENYYPLLKTTAIAGVFELSFTAQPVDNTAYANKAATFAVLVNGGSKKYNYKWQYSNDGNVWSNLNDNEEIIGANTAVISISADASHSSGTQVRCVVSDNTGNMITSISAVFTKSSENYTILNAKNKLFDYFQNKGSLTQAREAFSLLVNTDDLSGFSASLPFYFTYADTASSPNRTGYLYWLLMDCYALGVDPHDYVARGKDVAINMNVIETLLNLQLGDTGGFKKYYSFEEENVSIPAIILSLEMYFNGRDWGNEKEGANLGRDAAIEYFFSQIKSYDAGGRIYDKLILTGGSNAIITSIRAQAEAVILLARLSNDEIYGIQAKEAMNNILTAMNDLYNTSKISYTENMALYVSALVAAAEADTSKPKNICHLQILL